MSRCSKSASMRRSAAIGFGESSIALKPHRFAPMLVHGANGGFGDQRIGSTGLLGVELDQMPAVRHPLHAVLDEFDRLVVFEAEEARRPHQIALAQAMPGHGLVVAFEAEHGPLHDELVRT